MFVSKINGQNEREKERETERRERNDDSQKYTLQFSFGFHFFLLSARVFQRIWENTNNRLHLEPTNTDIIIIITYICVNIDYSWHIHWQYNESRNDARKYETTRDWNEMKIDGRISNWKEISTGGLMCANLLVWVKMSCKIGKTDATTKSMNARNEWHAFKSLDFLESQTNG